MVAISDPLFRNIQKMNTMVVIFKSLKNIKNFKSTLLWWYIDDYRNVQ